MAQLVTVRLSRGDAQPWGLRLQGGKDFGTPLVVQKVNMGSLSDQAGLQVGDAIIKVNNVDAFNLRHKDAQDLIVKSGNAFELTVQRGGGTWRPSVTPTGAVPSPTPNYGGNYLPTVTKTSLAHKQPESKPIGTGYNNAARPFGGAQQQQNGGAPVQSIVNKQYNTPVGIYSEESIAETLSAQAEVLAGGVLGVNFKKNEKVYNSANSEVLKALQEAESEPSEPERHATQSPHYHQPPQSHINQQHQQDQPPLNYQQIKQQFQQPSPQQHQPPQQQQQQYHSHHQPQPQQQNLRAVTPVAIKHVTAPVNQAPAKPAATGPPTGQNICAECERLIVGVFVRIKDKNLHVDCFKCATCGSSLKNQGYFNLNNKLYCDIHAKMAAISNPPPGTKGYEPVPIQPNTKLSASTISAALNAHQVNGSNNVNSSLGGPKPFNYGPPAAAPKSPASYPAPAQNAWAQPKPQQQPQYAPAPVANQFNGNGLQQQQQPQPNYGSATLPRPAGHNAPGRYNQPQHQHQPQHHYQAPQHHYNQPAPQHPHQHHQANYGYNNNTNTSSNYYNQGAAPAGPGAPGAGNKALKFGATSAPKRGRGVLNQAGTGGRVPQCGCCSAQIRGPFITALGKIWCPDHFVCVSQDCRRPLQDIGFVEEKGDLYCEYCFEKYLAPPCDKCNAKIKGDCLNAIGKHFHPECFTCTYCGKLFGNSPFFLEEGQAYCEADWNELFTTKCFACGFPVEAGDRWVEALSHNYHSQCFNCTMCKKNLEGQSFFAKGGRPYCKAHAR